MPVWSDDNLQHVHQTPDKQRRVRDMFTAIADSYDLNNRLHSFGRDQAWRRKTVQLAQLKSADLVVDVACGTGDLSVMLGRYVDRPVIGIDYTLAMLPIAQKKRGNALYIQGDAMNLPLADASVDVVTIAFGLRNVQDAPKALSEFRRVLRPGGRVLVLEFCEPTNPLIRFGNDLYTKRIMPWTASLIARDQSGAYRYLPKSVSSFYNRFQMLDAMKQADFVDLHAYPMTFGVCVCYRGRTPPQ